YCRAPVSLAATAKEVPRQSSLFAERIGNSLGRCPQSETRNPQCQDASDASRPGANGGVPAAVGMQERERVGGSRPAANRDEDAAAPRQGFEDAAVVRLEADAAHRAGQ